MTPAELHGAISQTLQKKGPAFEHDLKAAYDNYIHSVSEKDVASSMETCVMLMVLCAAFDSERVMDLGSGFSSYALRLYKQKYQPGLEVHSIETDGFWLNKTKAFVDQNGLDMQGFHIWEEAKNLSVSCDMIFLDIQDYPRRQEYLPQVISRFCHAKTKILLDDMHWPRYRHAISEILWRQDYTHLNLEKETRDQFGRFAGLICAVSG
jgi:predicted O-methyltransferase YrrM